MVQGNSKLDDPGTSSHIPVVTTSDKPVVNDKSPATDNYDTKYPTETVAALTIAILAVVIVITMMLVFRALRKRQRALQGEQFGENHIPTISTGVMGTGGSAYMHASSVNTVPVQGQIRWQSINSGAENTTPTPQR